MFEDGFLCEWFGRNSVGNCLFQVFILVCIIDYLMFVSESLCGGYQIVLLFCLMIFDLVFDEVDDFDIDDLFVLLWLVYWVGLFGSCVLFFFVILLLVLVQGLFEVYCSGWEIFQCYCGVFGCVMEICCVWFDEFFS